MSIESLDPSPAFLARFDGHAPPVKKGSEFRVEKGLLFSIRSYTRLDRNTVKIRGGYYEGDLSASSATYTFEKKEGKWTLKSVGPMVVS